MFTVFANNHVDICLGFAVKSVEVVAALSFLKVNVDSSSYILGCSHIVAVHTAYEVNSLTCVGLNHTEFICSACNGSCNYADSSGGSFGSFAAGSAAFELNAVDRLNPSVLHLRSALVITDYTVNYDCIANCGLGIHSVKSVGTGLVVGTVNKDLVTFCILDIHITVCITGNVNDRSADVVLAFSIVYNLTAKLDSLGNGKSGISFGNLNGGLLVRCLGVCVFCSNDLHYVLRIANFCRCKERTVGKRNGLVYVVSTNAVGVVVDIGHPSAAHLSIVIEYCAVCSAVADELGNLFAVLGGISVNVVLNIVNHSVELVSAFNLFYIEYSCNLGIVGCVDELVAAILSGIQHVEVLLILALVKEELVIYAFLGLGNNYVVVNNDHSEGVGSSLGVAVSIGDGSGDREGELLGVVCGKLYSVVACGGAGNDFNLFVVSGPGNLEELACAGNLTNNVKAVGNLAAVLAGVELVKINISLSKTGTFLFAANAEPALYGVNSLTAGENTKAENGKNQKCNNSFHFFLLYILIFGKTKL